MGIPQYNRSINGDVNLYLTDFIDNYIAVGIYDYQVASPSNNVNIEGCNFTHSGSNLVAPYSTSTHPYKCIDVENVNGLQIGGFTANNFSDFQFGIYANISEVEVFNGTFDQNIALTTLSKPDPNYAVIFLIAPTSLSGNEMAECTVTDTYAGCTFTDNQIAVYGREYYLSCDNASFTGNYYDIRLRDFDGAEIWDNTFTGTSGTSLISVSVQNATPRLADLDIYGNLLTTYRKAIEFWYVLGNGSTYETNVYDNNIDFTTSSTAYRQGITALGCSYSKIYDNSIKKTFGVVGYEADRLVGIRVEQTTNADVYENTIDEMGRAMLGRGSLSGTQYWCNTMDRYYEGWYFDNATNLFRKVCHLT